MKRLNADLHNHLKTGSYMPEGIFNKAVDIARKRLGESGIMGVVNFEDRRYENFSELRGYERQDFGNAVYVPEKDILVVKGQEFQTQEGHLLVLGLMKDVKIKAGRTLDDAINEARDNNGIIIADHPFYFNGIGKVLEKNPEYLEKIDAIEVFNGEAFDLHLFPPKRANERALSLFSTSKLEGKFDGGGLIASDGHSLYEIGTNYTELDMFKFSELKNAEDIASSLRKAVRAAIPCGKRKALVMGALGHISNLGLFISASKIGINVKNL